MEAITKAGHVEIDGVVFNQKLVKYLKDLQENDYHDAIDIRNSIAEASCFIGRMINFMDCEDDAEAIEIIRNLGVLHGEFKNFLSSED